MKLNYNSYKTDLKFRSSNQQSKCGKYNLKKDTEENVWIMIKPSVPKLHISKKIISKLL